MGVMLQDDGPSNHKVLTALQQPHNAFRVQGARLATKSNPSKWKRRQLSGVVDMDSRGGKSCSTNVIAFYEDINSWVDGRRAVDVIDLDFNKAFDTVSQDILITNLRKCGIDE